MNFFKRCPVSSGWNNNPTSKQFSYAYRHFLFRAGVFSFSDGNCVNFADNEECVEESVFVEEECVLPSSFVSNIVTYICGFVVRSVMKREACEDCKLSLVRMDAPTSSDGDYLFLTLKNNGELIVPYKEVIFLKVVIKEVKKSFKNCRILFPPSLRQEEN